MVEPIPDTLNLLSHLQAIVRILAFMGNHMLFTLQIALCTIILLFKLGHKDQPLVQMSPAVEIKPSGSL